MCSWYYFLGYMQVKIYMSLIFLTDINNYAHNGTAFQIDGFHIIKNHYKILLEKKNGKEKFKDRQCTL